jgi:hypothetical protein
LDLGQAIEKCNFRDNLDEIVVNIKSDHSKATRKLISLMKLSQDSWDMKVEPVLKQERLRFPGINLRLLSNVLVGSTIV